MEQSKEILTNQNLTPDQTVKKSKKPFSRSFYILISIILIIGLSIAGYYYYISNYLIPKPITPFPTPTIDFNREPTSSAATTNWKTYTNSKYQFSLKYPPSWNYKSAPKYPDIIFFSPYTIGFPEDSEGPFTPVRVAIRQTDVEKDISSFKNAYQYKDFKDENVIIDKVSSRKISGVVTGVSYAKGQFNTEVFIPTTDKITQLSFYETKEVKRLLFDQILSTFKFLPALLPSPTITAGKYTIQLKSRQFTPDPNLNIVPIQQAAGPNGRVHFLLQVKELPNAAGRQKFTEQGINLLNYVSGYSYIASAKSIDLNKIQNLTNVRWVGPLEPDDKIDPELKSGNIGKWARTSDGRVALTIQVHSDVSIAEAKSLVTRLGGTPTGSIPTVPSVTALFDPSQVEQIAREDAVQYIDMVEPPLQPNTKNLSPATAN